MATPLTKNFMREEFACHDGTPVPLPYYDAVKRLAMNLQVLRDELGEPVHVVSGYRTSTYNAQVGGAKKSQHLQAKAADITVKSKSPQFVFNTIERLIRERKMEQGGMGLYNGFVHYDIRGRRDRWVG